MKRFSKGGIHPPEEKISAAIPLARFPAPEVLYVPVSQHLGAPAQPVVEKGQDVRKGQLIAAEGGRVSSSIHSPVSGKVTGIENRLTVVGFPCPHIIIKNDGEDTLDEGIGVERETQGMKRDEIIAAVQKAGIVGMGGATFPTHVKLVPPNPVDVLIVNGAECEPYLTCDHRLMLENPSEVVSGVSLLQRAIGATRAIIGVESNKPDAAAKLEQEIKAQRLAGMDVELLRVRYPQGAEKQLIEALVGRRVPPRQLPFAVGVICQNVGTAYAVWQACRFQRPLIERALTVSGDGVERPANLIASIGTPFSAIMESCGLKESAKKIICGGPMMGISIPDLDYPVVKGTSGILALTKMPRSNPLPCIRCGRCVERCPMGLMPAVIGHAVEGGNVDEYDELGIPDCVECGCCSYICPARRPLVHLAKKGKSELAARKKK